MSLYVILHVVKVVKVVKKRSQCHARDPLTLNFCGTSSVTCSNSVLDLNEIEVSRIRG